MFKLSSATAEAHRGLCAVFIAASALLAPLLILAPSGAQAQYFAGTEPGYRLDPVPAAQQLAIQPGSAEFAALSRACLAQGLDLHGAFRVQASMSRFFGVNTFSLPEQGIPAALEEQQLSSTRPQMISSLTYLPPYSFDGKQVCVGMAQAQQSGEEYNWNPLLLVSFALSSDPPAAELLSQWELPAQYSEGIYALDMVFDGVIELVVPWATGVAGGGGADVVAVVPTGGLAGFAALDGDGEDEHAGSSFYSASGNINLLDWDGDGNWELETSYSLLASIYSYNVPVLYTFDTQNWGFADARARFPAYYAPSDSFYRALLSQLELALKRPQDFYHLDDPYMDGPGYLAQIDGAVYSLDPFIIDSEPPGQPSYDDYSISSLRGFVASLAARQ